MRNPSLPLIASLAFALASCGLLGPVSRAPSKPVPPVPHTIMSQGIVSSRQLASFLLSVNPDLGHQRASQMAELYVREASLEGVSHDIAFAQMCLETGFLKFGGLVTPDMNNFCGLGSIGPGQAGVIFDTEEKGVRAHIQHLKGYATREPLSGELVDPRYKWIKYGSAPSVEGLTGKWASDREYGQKISAILARLYEFSFG